MSRYLNSPALRWTTRNVSCNTSGTAAKSPIKDAMKPLILV